MITQACIFRADLFTKADVGTVEQRLALVDQIRTAKKEDPIGVSRSNDGCWRKNFDEQYPLENADWLHSEINELLVQAVKFYSAEDHIYAKINRSDNVTVTCWANINQPGSRNSYHSHKGNHYVALYYLQGTTTGDLILANPANVLADCNLDAPYTHDMAFSPKDGDLILWPAWVPHEVEPNLSQRERINIAFNINIKS